MTFPTQLPSTNAALLWGSLPPARLASFLSESPNGNIDEALELYIWNIKLSTAFLADIAILEAALRESINKAAAAKWGSHWYLEIPLDERSEQNLAVAWSQLSRRVRERPNDGDVPGHLFANCTFGFWTNLFDKGGHTGKSPRRVRVNYEHNWEAALRHAFPEGRNVARQQHAGFTRDWVHGICKRVNSIRNRVAHHEPLIRGFPMPGQPHRMTCTEAHEETLKLARMLDPKLAAWLAENSDVPRLIAARPCTT